MAPIAPRTFWKEHEHKFPALAKVAVDVLSIPATGAERLFKLYSRTKLRTKLCAWSPGILKESTI
jgi:hypothetical protein